METSFKEVGIVKALYRFPVKSMAGEQVAASRLWWHGLDGDRRYAFVKTGNLTAFPWFTGRDLPEMLRYEPRFTDDNVIESSVQVRTPAGHDLHLESDELRTELAGKGGAPIHLMKSGRGTFDSLGLSLISTATLRELGERVNLDLDAWRFRTNILVETFDDTPFGEEQWLGALLAFGERDDAARVNTNRKIERCMMINLDPKTATQQPAVLREVTRQREQCTGIYATTQRPGRIKVGDTIRLLRL